MRNLLNVGYHRQISSPSVYTQTFELVTGNCGFVQDSYSGVSDEIHVYSGGVGVDNCIIFRQPSNPEPHISRKALFQFDTSSIPDDAIISGVEFYQVLRMTQPPGEPGDRVFYYDFGQIIGISLDGTVGEYCVNELADNGSDYVIAANGSVSPILNNTWINLLDQWTDEDKTNYLHLISKTGTTDIRIWDDSHWDEGDLSWGIDFNLLGARPSYCKLRITYIV